MKSVTLIEGLALQLAATGLTKSDEEWSLPGLLEDEIAHWLENPRLPEDVVICRCPPLAAIDDAWIKRIANALRSTP